MEDPQLGEQMDRNYKLASALDINGTPAFIIGDRLIPGTIDTEALATIVSEERTKQQEANAHKEGSAAANK